MAPDRLATIAKLPAQLRAAGVEPDLFFHEPGGTGARRLSWLPSFSGCQRHAGGDLLKDAAKAAIKGAIAWARERIRRQPGQHEAPPERERPAIVSLYDPIGERLRTIEVTSDSVDDRYMHPIIAEKPPESAS